jgi:O-methyltransferase
VSALRERYLDLLELSLTGILLGDAPIDWWSGGIYDPDRRRLGMDWPGLAQTMIGAVRMRHLRHLCEHAIAHGVEGDFVETGVWRGGACIYMRGILAAYDEPNRRVIAADSFVGLPPPDPSVPNDIGDQHHKQSVLAVSRTEVEANFTKYGLLDDRVVFLEGWFKDTLPRAPIERISVLRLDGDMYGSTMVALEALYPKVSEGGAVIIDDFGLAPCRQAVIDFRARMNIEARLEPIDSLAVWWRI